MNGACFRQQAPRLSIGESSDSAMTKARDFIHPPTCRSNRITVLETKKINAKEQVRREFRLNLLYRWTAAELPGNPSFD